MSLYEKILEGDFSKLHTILQRYHNPVGDLKATGFVDIYRGKGLLVKLISFFANFPPAGKNVKTLLTISVHDKFQYWNRYFENHLLKSQQHTDGKYLIEKFGPVTSYMELTVENGELIYKQILSEMLGIKIPKMVEIDFSAKEWHCENQICFDITVFNKFIGLIVKYQGKVSIEN